MLAEKTFLSKLGTSGPEVMARLHQEIARYQDAALQQQDHWLHPRAEGAWSPAQITEHVILISRAMSRVLLAFQMPEFPDFPRAKGEMKNGKMQSPPYGLPTEGKSWEDLHEDWTKTHIRLIQAAEGVQNWQDSRTFTHPFFGELTVLEWLQMATYHLIHHRRQLA